MAHPILSLGALFWVMGGHENVVHDSMQQRLANQVVAGAPAEVPPQEHPWPKDSLMLPDGRVVRLTEDHRLTEILSDGRVLYVPEGPCRLPNGHSVMVLDRGVLKDPKAWSEFTAPQEDERTSK